MLLVGALAFVALYSRSGAQQPQPSQTLAASPGAAEGTAPALDSPDDSAAAQASATPERQDLSALTPPDAPRDADAGLTPEALFDKVASSVVAVQASRPDGVAQGSGVVVAPRTVVTNRHVVEAARQVRILQGKRTWQINGVVLDATHDLARLDAPDLDLPPIALMPRSPLRIGERAYTIGAPQGLELTLSEGLVSGLRRFEWGEAIQTTAAISQGSSGGGLFDSRGHLIGITTFLFKEGQNLNFALPAEWATEIKGETLTVRPGWNPAPVAVADQQPGQGASPEDEGTTTDKIRARGAQIFEAKVAALAKKADELDDSWRRYQAACLTGYTRTYAYGRAWFGVWDGVAITPNKDLPACRALLSDIRTLAAEITYGMNAAEQEAHSHYVYPGVRRDIRRRYYMDWRGWSR